MKTIFITIFFSLILTACVNTQQMAINMVKQKGTSLKEYPDGENDYYMVVKEGQKINKYRLYNWSAGGSYGTRIETVYSIDPVTKTCYTGTEGQTPIECEKVKNDKDLTEYITW